MKIPEHLTNDKLYCIYDDEDDENFFVGYWIYSDDRFSIFTLLNDQGYEDGVLCTLTDSINRIDYDNLYSNRIRKLSKIYGQEPMKIDCSFAPNPMVALFEYSKSHSYFVKAELNNGEVVVGEVESTNEDITVIHAVTNDGIEDGTSIIRNDFIVRCGINCESERSVRKLRELNRS